MNQLWRLEFNHLVWLVVCILFIGIFSGYWVVAVALPLGGYIGWSLYQLYQLDRWFQKGLSAADAPVGGGAWGELVQQIFRQKEREEKRKKRLKELLIRFNATVSALPDAAVVLNKRYEIEWANDPARRLLGIDKSRDAGLRIRNLIRAKTFVDFITADHEPLPIEMPSPVDTSVTLLLQVVRFGKKQKLLLARDISQRVEAQRSRKAFVDNASHELKSPLTVVMGYLELLELSPDLPQSLREPVLRAFAQAEHMRHIIEDLLILSRLEEQPQPNPSIQLLDVSELIEDAVMNLQSSGRAVGHQIESNIDLNLKLRIDESCILSIVTNLLGNAVQHTPAGTRVFLQWRRLDDGDVCFSVADNGPGVAAEHLPHLAERFYRADPGRAKSTGGTGLGLAIVKHSAERYGGVFSISRAAEGGMLFRVCFPQAMAL